MNFRRDLFRLNPSSTDGSIFYKIYAAKHFGSFEEAKEKIARSRNQNLLTKKKGFPGLKTPFAKPFPAIQKLRTAPEIATIYLEQVIKQND